MNDRHFLKILQIMYYAFNMDQHHQTHAKPCIDPHALPQGMQLGRCIWQHADIL